MKLRYFMIFCFSIISFSAKSQDFSEKNMNDVVLQVQSSLDMAGEECVPDEDLLKAEKIVNFIKSSKKEHIVGWELRKNNNGDNYLRVFMSNEGRNLLLDVDVRHGDCFKFNAWWILE
ncbi:hypothetical protein [Zavarzinia compransoris]|uniref:hypothetical protein n=1 Tax=Zavarzinia compransoris TaxID=1264899 RepID=UPI0010611119|nr:hypothetical protein [Zavarzinia compransoris]